MPVDPDTSDIGCLYLAKTLFKMTNFTPIHSYRTKRPINPGWVARMNRVMLMFAFPICTAAAPPSPEPYCKQLPFDEENPPGLVGDYEIIGKEAVTGRAYTGALEITVDKDTYVLSRTVEGRILKGAAWVESCSPDRFQVLRARYDSMPEVIDLSCYLRFDGDNYTRASCTTLEGEGLEAWYQSHEAFAP